MMRYYDIVEKLEEIRRTRKKIASFETENAREYDAHLKRLEFAYLRELARTPEPEAMPELPRMKYERRPTIGKFI